MRQEYVGLIALAGIGALLALGWDWFSTEIMSTKPLNGSWRAPDEIVSRSYGFHPYEQRSASVPSCFGFGEKGYDASRWRSYLSCQDAGLVRDLRTAEWGKAKEPSCWPIDTFSAPYRYLPFTRMRLRDVIFAAGQTGADVEGVLRSARDLSLAEYRSLYDRNGQMAFYNDPSPGIASVDCAGYSVTVVEYDPAPTQRGTPE